MGRRNASEAPHRSTSERHIRELEALYEIGQSLSTIHDLEHLLRFAIERVRALLVIEAASVILLHEERQELYFEVVEDSREGAERRLRGLRFPADQGIAGFVLREGVSIVVPDVEQDPRFYRGVDEQTATKTKSLLCAPLRTKDRILGVLNAVNKCHGPFLQEDVRLLEAFASQLAIAIENASLIQALEAANERLRDENVYLKREVERDSPFENIIGKSPVMKDVFNLLEKVTNSAVTVLLSGETGTGKGLIAHHIHYHGPRRGKFFITQNCGAVPETLLESELFGHKRGAFTGAVQDKKGLFEVANAGTIFLDEVGEMSPAMQVKLLQVLQEGKFRRIGETEHRHVDVRTIAATNKDLEAEVEKGTFRVDLYYRLNVFPIRIPPLRERRQDIPLLAEHFLEKYCKKMNKQVAGFSQDAMEFICGYDFPGNVRELENLIERAVILSSGSKLEFGEWLPKPRIAPRGTGISTLEAVERDHILERMQARRGNMGLVASDLGISRTTLWRRIKKYQIETRATVRAEDAE